MRRLPSSRSTATAPAPAPTPALTLAFTLTLAVGCGATTPHEPAGPNGSTQRTVTVLAAASLTEPFTVLEKRFEKTHQGVDVKIGFGASSTLAAQIESGAPADVYAAAATDQMKDIATKGEPEIFANNRLEIAVPKGNPAQIKGLEDLARDQPTIAVCAAQVPCGKAAAKAFKAAGLKPRPDTYGTDVKAVLTSVRSGEVDAGLVYHSDIVGESKVDDSKVDGIEFPEATRAINHYPIAVLENAPDPNTAKAFVDFVRSEEGLRTLRDHGFET